MIVANLCEIVAIVFLIIINWSIIDFGRTSHGVKAIKHLMIACFPVCIANLLSFYLTNAPKYAIDGVMDETAQAKYNFIAMPVFVIQLMNMFIYQPVLVKMAITWKADDFRSFKRYFWKIMLSLAAISAVVLTAAWFFGIQVLSILYATNLADLKKEFMIIMISSIFLALTGFYNSILTIMRHQNAIPLVYIVGSILSVFLTNAMVYQEGIYGAVSAYLIIMLLLSAVLLIIYEVFLHRAMKYNINH